MAIQDTNPAMPQPRRPRKLALELAGIGGLVVLVALSAVVTKQATARRGLESLASVTTTTGSGVPLVSTTTIDPPRQEAAATVDRASEIHDPLVPVAEPVVRAEPTEVEPAATEDAATYASAEIRYFNGRPVRPSRTMTMVVTAYSPDEKSCGPNARGITSSVHSVQTNGMKLVAADTRVLPLGSMITVPGYDSDNIVPVLDRGGAIKGNRLDVLFPTDSAARQWGVKKLKVVVWEYADNLPADDYRAIRDSRN